MQIECPECSTNYELPDEYIGKKLKCKNCESIFEVTEEEEIEDSPEEDDDEVLFDMEDSGNQMPEINDKDFEISFEEMPDEEDEEDEDEGVDEEEEEIEEKNFEKKKKSAKMPPSISRRRKRSIRKNSSRKNKSETRSPEEPLEESTEEPTAEKGSKVPVIILAVLCILFAGAGGFLGYLWQKADKKGISAEKNLESAKKELASLKNEKILFLDNFDTSLIKDRWLPNKGAILEYTPKGRMKISSNATAMVFCRTGFKGDVRIEYDAKISPLKGNDTISDLSFMLVADTAKPIEKGYYFGIGNQGNTQIKITRKNKAILTKRGSPITQKGIYHFRIECRNGGVVVYISNIREKTPEKAIVKLENAKMPPNGFYFGFYTLNSELLVDKVKVVKLD